MSLLVRKLEDYARLRHEVSIRLADGAAIQGIIKDIDDHHTCLIAKDGGEIVIELNAIQSLQAYQDHDLRSVLTAAKQNARLVKVTLSDKSTIEGVVADLDTTMVSLQLDKGERLLRIQDVADAELKEEAHPSPLLSDSAPAISPTPTPLVIVPRKSPVTSEMFPSIARESESIQSELATLNWPKDKLCDIERTCPVSIRIDSKAERIWGRALNYYRGRSWSKAAEDFKTFANEYPGFYTGFHNAAICYNLFGDIDQVITCCDLALQRQEVAETYLIGIMACVRMRFWRLTLDWMKRFLILTSGSDSDAFRVIEFQLKFGLYKDAVQTIQTSCRLIFPIDSSFALKYIAYVATQEPALSLQLLGEIEQGLGTSRLSIEQLLETAQLLEQSVKNQASIDYSTSENIESRWHESQKEKDRRDQLATLHRKLSEAVTANRRKEVQELCEAILKVDPDDPKAKSQKTAVPTVIAPRPVPAFTSTFRRSNPKGSYQLANRLMQQNKLKEAEGLFQRCVANGDNVENSIKNLANIYLRMGDFNKGIDILNKYVANAHEKEPYYNILGQLYFKTAQYEKTIEVYTIVRDMQTSDAQRINPMMSIAATYVRLGRQGKATEVLQKVLRINPNNAQAKNILERLRSNNQSTDTGSSVPNQIDIDAFISLLSRPVGTATVRISDFMRLEIEQCTIRGLSLSVIEKKEFTLKQAEYLYLKGIEEGTSKPEQRAPFFISAAKILFELGEEKDDRFNESLRNFCATTGDYYAIINRDVARTYYMEAFKLDLRVTSQLQIKLGQMMMTLLYADKAVFLRPHLPARTSSLLASALAPTQPTMSDATYVIVALARINADVIPTLFQYMVEEPDLRLRLANALAQTLKVIEKPVTKEEIGTLITQGQEILGQEQAKIEAELRYFLDNSGNHQRLYDVHRRFLEFSPNFPQIGMDFNKTDTNRIEAMKSIIQRYIEFYDEHVFERREVSYSYILNQIQTLESDIKDFPTYYGRCYLSPLLHAWTSVIRQYFEELERVSQPDLRVIEVAKCASNHDRIEAHLVISNREGKSAASGIKVWILPSKADEYIVDQEAFDVGKTIRSGSDATVPVSIFPITNEPVLTLNYRLTYMNREGKEIPSEDMTLPLRMEESAFEPIDPNPYAAWANADAVTDKNMFKGRDALVEELLKHIQIEKQKKMIVIYGQKRAGKSSILFHVADRMSFPAVPIFFSLGRIALNLNIDNLFYNLARELHKALAKVDSDLAGASPTRDQFETDAFGEFVDYAENLLTIFRAKPQYSDILPVLILDEFTYIYAGIQKGEISLHFMKAWKSLVEKKFFSFLLSGIDEMPDFINAYSNEFGMAELKRVSYLSDQGARDLVERPIWNKSKNTSRFQESAVRRVMELTANSAFYIQIVNNKLVNYMNKEHTGYVTEADINRIVEVLTTPGRPDNLNLAANFDNLTRFKTGSVQPAEYTMEGLLLRIIAFVTRNQDFASKQVVLSKFSQENRNLVENLIQRLIDREVLTSQAGHQQYAIRVELFKYWLNGNVPYREGGL